MSHAAALPSPIPHGLRPWRDPQPLLERALREWGEDRDLWLFGYGSLLWRPEFDFIERRAARVHGWHRALRMWSRVNRGTPELPGLVLGLFAGGSCQGLAFRVARSEGREVMTRLWAREMVTAVYDARWLHCRTPEGPVQALAFTLSRHSPSHAGELSEAQYRHIFRHASGIYGSTLDYAARTYEELRRMNIRDRQLERLLRYAHEHVHEHNPPS